MASKLTPLADRIIAKQAETQSKTASGFYLPDDAKDKPEIAKVISVGKDVQEVKKGDTVIYKTYNSPVKIDGEEYLILKEEEVLATVN